MNPEIDDDFEEGPSKSQRKRDMHALQDMGAQLVALSEKQLAEFELPEDLRRAIAEMRNITKNEARRRHLQFIGKLMRKADAEAIALQLEARASKNHLHVQHQHITERWRDRLLAGESGALEEFIGQYPDVDIQHLRQLIRQAQKEQSQNKPPAHARKLFRYLRDILLQH